MYFVVRNSNYIDLTGKSFRDFLTKKIKGIDIEPKIDDWEMHMTTVFPEVRLKSFIELRGADGGPWSRVCALPAFWTGILYDENVLDEVSDIIRSWSLNDVMNFYEDTRRNGLKAMSPKNEGLHSFSKKIINLSSRGLRNRNFFKSGKSEESFLEPLNKILDSGRSPAEEWKILYLNQWSNDIDMLYKHNHFK